MVVENSKAGYQFFSKVGEVWKSTCITANGKSNILNVLSKQKGNNILVIADFAALGSEIREIMYYISTTDLNIDLYLPESFEWLILKSQIFANDINVQDILANPVNHIESSEYFSWERYFTALLVETSKDKPKLKYPKNKVKLPSGYLTSANVESIIGAMKNS